MYVVNHSNANNSNNTRNSNNFDKRCKLSYSCSHYNRYKLNSLSNEAVVDLHKKFNEVGTFRSQRTELDATLLFVPPHMHSKPNKPCKCHKPNESSVRKVTAVCAGPSSCCWTTTFPRHTCPPTFPR